MVEVKMRLLASDCQQRRRNGTAPAELVEQGAASSHAAAPCVVAVTLRLAASVLRQSAWFNP